MRMPTILDLPHAIIDDRGYDLSEVTVYNSFWDAWKVYCAMLREEGHDVNDDARSLTDQSAWDIYMEDEDREIVPVQDERNP